MSNSLEAQLKKNLLREDVEKGLVKTTQIPVAVIADYYGLSVSTVYRLVQGELQKELYRYKETLNERYQSGENLLRIKKEIKEKATQKGSKLTWYEVHSMYKLSALDVKELVPLAYKYIELTTAQMKKVKGVVKEGKPLEIVNKPKDENKEKPTKYKEVAKEELKEPLATVATVETSQSGKWVLGNKLLERKILNLANTTGGDELGTTSAEIAKELGITLLDVVQVTAKHGVNLYVRASGLPLLQMKPSKLINVKDVENLTKDYKNLTVTNLHEIFGNSEEDIETFLKDNKIELGNKEMEVLENHVASIELMLLDGQTPNTVADKYKVGLETVMEFFKKNDFI